MRFCFASDNTRPDFVLITIRERGADSAPAGAVANGVVSKLAIGEISDPELANNNPTTFADPDGLMPQGYGDPIGGGRVAQSGPIDPGNGNAGYMKDGVYHRPAAKQTNIEVKINRRVIKPLTGKPIQTPTSPRKLHGVNEDPRRARCGSSCVRDGGATAARFWPPG
jgi:hypothetical protein